MTFSPLIMLPSVFAALGHTGLVFLLLDKWKSLELANGGEPILFVNASHFAAVPDTGPPWWVVFLPAWVAELGTVVFTVVALQTMRLAYTTSWRILQYTSMSNACASAIFKVMLMLRLEAGDGSWLVTFSPIYAGMVTQFLLHFRKPTDARGKRPGSPLSALGLLALVVSFKLEGVLSYQDSSWATVLWPLWGLGGFCGASLLLGVCCGVPLLLRREMQSQIACSLLTLLLLLLAVFMPALLASVRLTLWLDGDAHTTGSMILEPYVVSVVLLFSGLCILMVLLSMASRFRLLHPRAMGDEEQEDEGAVAALLAQFQAPKMLVRESSTLFRRVTGTSTGGDALLQADAQANAMEEGGAGADEAGTRLGDVELMPVAPGGSSTDRADGLAASPQGSVEGASQSSVEDGDADANGVMPGLSAGDGTHCDGTAAGDRSDSGTEKAAIAESFSDTLVGESESSLAVPNDLEDGEGTCWICCTAPANAVLMECGHGGMCVSCATQCWKKKPPLCPLCRARIIMVVKIDEPDDQGIVRVDG